jgi:predicted kinase
MELRVLIGLQAAGKTTYFQRSFAATHHLISKDLLRSHRHPAQRQAQLLGEALAAGHSVVVDNTNPTLADRAELIALGRTYGAWIVGCWFPPDLSGSLARNAQREGRARVPPVALYATATRLVPPTYAEGFDALYAVRIAEDGAFAVAEMPRPPAEDVGEHDAR